MKLEKEEKQAFTTLKKKHPNKIPGEAFEMIFLVEFGNALIMLPKIGLECEFDNFKCYREIFGAFGEALDKAVADPEKFVEEREKGW